MRTFRVLTALAVLSSLVIPSARAADQGFDFTEFNLGAARAVQGGGAAIGPSLVYVPHYGFWLGDRSASLGFELGVTSFRDQGKSGFLATQYGAYQAFQPIRNLELRLAAGVQRWENIKETSPYLLAEARVLLNHSERRYLKGVYAFYSYVAHGRQTEVSGGGLVLHWPAPPSATPAALVAAGAADAPSNSAEVPPTTLLGDQPVVISATLPDGAAPDSPAPELTILPAPRAGPAEPVDVVALTPPPVAVAPEPPAATASVTPSGSAGPGGMDLSLIPSPGAAVGTVVDAETTTLITGAQSGTFEPNSIYFGQVYRQKLKQVADALGKFPRAKVIVTGYADANESSPRQLAHRRAAGVKAFLVGAGVEAARLTVVTGDGSTRPPTAGSGETQFAARRVDLSLDRP